MSKVPEGWQRHAKMYRKQLLETQAATTTQIATLTRILGESDGEAFYRFLLGTAAEEAEPPEEGEE